MDPSVLGRAIDLAAAEYETCRFIWTGFEGVRRPVPLLKKILKRQRKTYAKDAERYANSVQVTVDAFSKGIVDCCSRNGVSLNLLHPFPAGGGPGGLDGLMARAAASPAGFSVSYPVHSGNVDVLSREFGYFNDLGVSVSFQPVHPGRANDWGHEPPPVDGYVGAMARVFDAWVSNGKRKVSVQPFAGHLAFLAGSRDPSDCAHSSCLMGWLSVGADGSVYPCGKGMRDSLRLGNLMSAESLTEFFDSDPFQDVLRDSVERRRACAPCDVYAWCNGGCAIDALDSGDMCSPGGFSCVADKGMFLRTARFFEEAFSQKADPREYPEAVADALLKRAIAPKAIEPRPIVPNPL